MSWPGNGDGPFGATTRAIIANANVLSTDGVIRMNTTAGTITAQLPLAALGFSGGIGQIFTFKKITVANVATVKAQPGELIDGFNTADITAQYESIAIQSNGVSWDVLFRSQ